MTSDSGGGFSLGTTRGVGIEAGLQQRSRGARVAHLLQRDGIGAFVVLLAFCMVASLLVDSFGTTGNLQNTLIKIAFPGIIAIGMTMVIISGGIDLSVGSVFGLSAILCTKAMDTSAGWGVSPVLGVAVALAASLLIGAVQGWLVAMVGLPAFIVTLAGLYGVRGLIFSISHNGDEVYSVPAGSAFYSFGRGQVAGFSYAIFIAVALYAGWHLLLTRTSFGLTTFAIGGSEDAAGLMGLKVRGAKWRLYVVSAGLAGLAGVLAAAYAQSGTPDMGTNYELNAIAAVVIGGTLLTGGAGSLIGTASGIALLGAVQSYINLGTDLPAAAQQVVTGVFVVAVVILQRVLNRAQGR